MTINFLLVYKLYQCLQDKIGLENLMPLVGKDDGLHNNQWWLLKPGTELTIPFHSFLDSFP